MKKIGIVILHYKNVNDTIECVDSIISNLAYNLYNIIIVDNASNDGSFSILERRYKKNEKIFLVMNKKNLGYAEGNNVGYRYARNVLTANYIIILNNDTILEQATFVDEIIKIDKDEKFGVLGPDIISLKGGHQNPLREKPLDLLEVKKMIKVSKLRYLYTYFKFLPGVNHFKTKAYGTLGILEKAEVSERVNKSIVLHGACLIFSESYLKYFENAFFSETFLYAEEDILQLICEKNEFKMIYSDKLKIKHKEDGSIENIFTKNRKKERFVLKYRIKSLKIFYRLCKEYRSIEKN